MYVQALLTLTGSAQALSTATGVAAAFNVSANAALGNLSCREIHIQPEGGNSNIVKFGDSHITTSLYSFVMPAPIANVPSPPMILGAYARDVIYLDDIYALGTAGEKVHIGLVI
jgi:hypothetical protein